jgi:hypothetical protein
MTWVAVAVAGAGVAGGLIGASGARSAASTQADAATNAAQVQSGSSDKALALQEKLYNQQAALQEKLYNQQVGLQEPYRQAGLTGQNQLMQLLGLGGDTSAANYGQYAKNFGMSDFQADPGYAFRLAQGQKALDQQAAARGGLISGNALKAATGYGQDMASQEYQNAFNRYQTNRSNQLQPLGNLMASGQSAASNQGAAAGNYGSAQGAATAAYGSNAGNLITGQGNAMAGGITNAGQANAAGQYGAANSIANMLNTGASAYQTQNNFNNWLASRQPSVIPMQPGGGY